MYKPRARAKSQLTSVETIEGETIEQKIERIMSNKEPIKDGAPEIYTERKDGVIAAYNIRTDRFEIAADAMDAAQRSIQARREERAKAKETQETKKTKGDSKVIEMKNDGGAEPIQGKATGGTTQSDGSGS